MRRLKESLLYAKSKPDISRVRVSPTAHGVLRAPKPYFNKCPEQVHTNQQHAKEMPLVHWPGHPSLQSKPSGKLWRL